MIATLNPYNEKWKILIQLYNVECISSSLVNNYVLLNAHHHLHCINDCIDYDIYLAHIS
jgi:hypothetical protein